MSASGKMLSYDVTIVEKTRQCIVKSVFQIIHFHQLRWQMLHNNGKSWQEKVHAFDSMIEHNFPCDEHCIDVLSFLMEGYVNWGIPLYSNMQPSRSAMKFKEV